MESNASTPRVRTEIEALHRDLAAWLSGRCRRDGAFFETAFRAKFHDAFFNVQPAGIVLSRADLLHSLDNGYGRSPAFDIRIDNVHVHQEPEAGRLLLATYEEYQKGARNSDRAENARLSTVLFEATEADTLIWRAIHETWLPDSHHAPERFRF